MKKKNEKRGAKGASPGAPRNAKGAGIIPSRTWWEGARSFWRGLAFREKALILMGVIIPALDQISRLASLGITMKAVSKGIRQPLDLDARLWLGLVILAATGVSALIQLFSSRVKRKLKVQVTRMVRRVYGAMMAETAELPRGERDEKIESLVNEERNFMTSATSGVSASIEFVAAVFIVVFLLGVLTWFNWIVGAIILGSGLVALLVLRFRIKSVQRKENENLVEARKKMTQQLESIASGLQNRKVLIESYANNDYDSITFADLEAKSALQKRISMVMNLGSAVLMAVVFFLVSAKGAFDETKVVWMVVFIFGLRMVVAQGKTAMVKWGAILAEKATLMDLARASIRFSQRQTEEQDQEPEVVLKDSDSPLAPPKVPRITSYLFSGPDRGDIVSGRPLFLEITVESEAEVRGFYWSFSISRPAGPPFVISKTSLDCGVKWDLEKGVSQFRMMISSLWLYPGKYSAMVGIASKTGMLDLKGSDDERIILTVLPNDLLSKSLQTRPTTDVVVADVEFERDPRHKAF